MVTVFAALDAYSLLKASSRKRFEVHIVSLKKCCIPPSPRLICILAVALVPLVPVEEHMADKNATGELPAAERLSFASTEGKGRVSLDSLGLARTWRDMKSQFRSYGERFALQREAC